MRRSNRQFKPVSMACVATVLFCLISVPTVADDSRSSRSHLLKSAHANPGQARMPHPGTPMVLDPATSAFEFDLGGSETRKLQLQLSHPLILEPGSHLQSSASGTSMLGLGASLNVPLSPQLNLTGGVQHVTSQAPFQSLGSIQCMNGTLGPDSYTASGCRFVNQSAPLFDRRTLQLGAEFQLGGITSAVNWFTSEVNAGATPAHQQNTLTPSPLLDSGLMTQLPANLLMPGMNTASQINSETTGIDLSFQVGFTTDNAGDLHLGLALTRVFDAHYESFYESSLGPLNWNLAEPFNAASLGLEWQRGSFSSGIRGYYRDSVNFLNQGSLNSMSTFDVHFTWRTPWNANLSVGASNVLGAGVDDRPGSDEAADRFESIYGRIPYVRYQQDL